MSEETDRERRLLKAFKTAFGSEDGLLVLENLRRECYADVLTLVPGDAMGTAFNEGKRYVWLHISRLVAREPVTEEETAISKEMV